METLYLGAKDASDRYRIYDKAKEQNLDNVKWWRIEQQIRLGPDEIWELQLPFSDLYAMQPSERLAPQDRFILDGLFRNPELWGHLSRRYREKYRAMLKDHHLMTKLDPWPQDAFYDYAQPITDQLTAYMKG